MHVRVGLEQHDAIRIWDQENQYIRVLAAQMQVHDAPIGQQRIFVQIDASPIMAIRDAVTAFYAFDDVVEVRPEVWALADACEIVKLDGVNRSGFGLDPPQPLTESRSRWLQSPYRSLCRFSRVIWPRLSVVNVSVSATVALRSDLASMVSTATARCCFGVFCVAMPPAWRIFPVKEGVVFLPPRLAPAAGGLLLSAVQIFLLMLRI